MHHSHNRFQQNAVLATLAYHDIFDYPLSIHEIEKFVVSHEPISSSEIHEQVKNKHIEEKLGWYFLKGREHIVDSRLNKQRSSIKKLHKARRIAKMLSQVSTILYIGVSGSLAMKNASEKDDIDFFIITKPHTLWITRLLVTLLLLRRGYLRTYAKKTVKDMVCTNMWVDTEHVLFDEERQNVYTAHELAQMYSLYNKENTYQQLLASNAWMQQFLPNIKIQKRKLKKRSAHIFWKVLNIFAKEIQVRYMRRHRTTETILDGFVAFHPKDYTQEIIQAWEKRFKIYGI